MSAQVSRIFTGRRTTPPPPPPPRYVIQWRFQPGPEGGKWGGPWTEHTRLTEQTPHEARATYENFVRQFRSEVHQYFRLAIVRPEILVPLRTTALVDGARA